MSALTVGVRELKAQISEYLRRVKSGETIVITERGKPIGRIVPEEKSYVQFVTVKGKRLAVLSAEDWEALVEWLEDIEDTQIAREAFAHLKAAGGDRRIAGWLDWEEVEKELEQTE